LKDKFGIKKVSYKKGIPNVKTDTK